LGVAIQDIEPDMATALKLPSRNGVLISDVNLGSPAEKAGLRRGDVVLKVDNKPVDSAAQLRNLVAAAGAGSKTRLMIQRDGSSKDVDVVLGESQGSKSQERRLGGSPGPSQSDVGGLSLEELTPAMRQRLGIASQVRSGVVVVDVAQGSTADKAGLEPGDVLIELDGRPIQSVDDFRSRWNGKQGKRLLLVYSRGNTVYRVVSS
jgi:serine protease Do